MAKEKRPLTQQDAFDLSPAVREAAWGLKGHLLRNGHADESGRPMTAPDVNADVRARFEAWFERENPSVNWAASAGEGEAMRFRAFAWNGYRAAHADLAGEVTKLLRDVRSIYIGQERPAGDGCDAETWDRIEAALAKHTHQEKP